MVWPQKNINSMSSKKNYFYNTAYLCRVAGGQTLLTKGKDMTHDIETNNADFCQFRVTNKPHVQAFGLRKPEKTKRATQIKEEHANSADSADHCTTVLQYNKISTAQ